MRGDVDGSVSGTISGGTSGGVSGGMSVGVKADVYHHLGLGTSFSAGIFMRISPEFVIKRFR